jgi:hypothetical protein
MLNNLGSAAVNYRVVQLTTAGMGAPRRMSYGFYDNKDMRDLLFVALQLSEFLLHPALHFEFAAPTRFGYWRRKNHSQRTRSRPFSENSSQ